jgi:small-conductance mechanosensitive channel
MQPVLDALRTWKQPVLALAVVAVSVVAGAVLRRVVLARLARWAGGSSWRLDDALVSSLRRPWMFWFVLLGAYVAAKVTTVAGGAAAIVGRVLVSLLIVSLTLWAADLAMAVLARGPAADATAAAGAGATGVVRNATRLTVYAIGGLVLLSTLGISVTPVLTTLGIGGLAVALGLQDTLANLFAGIHLTMAKNVRVGDFVKLETGQEGVVDDIGWRATRVRTLPNSMVVFPNSRLVQSVVTNYDLPDPEVAVLVEGGVHYASDLEKVERVTGEVARDVMQTVPGGVRSFEPFIRYHGFGESSIDFTVILRARRFQDGFLVKHELVKRLAARFATEGIVIPYPIRALDLDQQSAVVRSSRGSDEKA